ncbi:MAG TPA: NAD(P)H-dependent glycerol-3-phosphate dehydrogenase [Thermoanaerobaculia bacterium]|jgi:glycerol-3-phosphate dehydrogenase (NAD(P)+)|nr:NAD(P)H-dependent glycerol-3-phosphate dehydrogenase [Thermoanaerobaculia bacterium]
MKLSIIGAGSFGTAVAAVAARCGNEVVLWAHDPNVAAEIRDTRHNPIYLPSIELDQRVHATSSLAEAVAFSDVMFMIVPSHHYRGVLAQMRPHLRGETAIVSATKGIEIDTLQRMSEVTALELGRSLRSFAVLSGPTFALEMARGDPTAAVIASLDLELAEEVQHALSSPTFRIYNSSDVTGVELAGSLKNVIAVAAGVIEGLGLGSNTTAALITRGLHEVTKLSVALGGRVETLAGLAGMGDLVLTCTGSLSRNRSVGVALGKGKPLAEILSESRTVAEGVRTSKAAKELADRHGIEMPITSEMYGVLHQGQSPRTALQRLMTRSLKAEAAP